MTANARSATVEAGAAPAAIAPAAAPRRDGDKRPSRLGEALRAARKIVALGVSGDGDTASIGIGQFVHLMRRNLPMIYIIEDNGVYGLTKGQFSATILAPS